MRATAQILESPKENRYHRTHLDEMCLGDVSTEQLQHYLASRRQMERSLAEETVADEIARLTAQCDQEAAAIFFPLAPLEFWAKRHVQQYREVGIDDTTLASVMFAALTARGNSEQHALAVVRSTGLDWQPTSSQDSEKIGRAA
jgi:hypothetical protein